MTGREEPTKRDLEANLHKRLYIPATGPGSRKQTKRFSRQGTSRITPAGSTAGLLKAGAGDKFKGAKGKGSVKAHRYLEFVDVTDMRCGQ